MARHAAVGNNGADEFARRHRAFVEHLAYAVLFAWATSAFAAWHAPWVHNIRGLIDPYGRSESTASYLFALPCVMLVALVVTAFGAEGLRRTSLLKNQAVEFGLAGLVAFGVFCLSIERAVTAFALTN